MNAHEVEAGDDRALTVPLEREAELVERLRPGNERAVVGPEPSGEQDGAKAGEVDLLGRLRVDGAGGSGSATSRPRSAMTLRTRFMNCS